MALEVDCGSCGGRFRVPDSAAGKKIRCPKCKGAIEVAAGAQPASDEPAPAPAAPAAPAPAPVVSQPVPKKAPAAVTAPAASPPARPAAPAPAVLKMPAPAPAKLETVAAKSAPAPAPKPAPPPPQEDTWYFQAEDGEVYGPVERSELEEWRREGRISPECRLRSSASDDWIVPSDLFPEIVPAAPEPEAEEPAAEEQPVAKPGKKKAAARTRGKSDEPAEDGEEPRSTRSKAVAFVLAFFLFWTGGHRFYLGYPALGVVLALTFGGLLIGSWIDAFCILFGALPDAEGRKLRD